MFRVDIVVLYIIVMSACYIQEKPVTAQSVEVPLSPGKYYFLYTCGGKQV